MRPIYQYDNSVEDFRTWLSLQITELGQPYSKVTIGWKISTIKMFLRENQIHSINEITQEVIDNTLARWLHAEKEKSGWLKYNVYLRMLRNIDRWKGTALSKTKKFIRCETIRPLKSRIFEFKEIQRILGNPMTDFELKSFIAIAFNTGMRIGEIKNLKISDIDFDTRTINVRETKTKQSRTVFISAKTKNVLMIYLQLRKDVSEYIFLKSGVTYRMKLKKLFYFSNPKVDSRKDDRMISPHAFRHTFATECAEQEMHMESIRRIFGWKSYSMMLKYFHLRPTKLKEAFDECQHKIEEYYRAGRGKDW